MSKFFKSVKQIIGNVDKIISDNGNEDSPELFLLYLLFCGSIITNIY